jgi:hypothetical protein
VPSRFLLAGVVVLSVLVLLLLMRVGPGTGAAAGPGPTPPHRNEPELPGRRWRLGAAALAGALVALDPVLVRGGRAATGSVLGRPLGSVWTSDGPALQAFDTMVLGAVPASSGSPAVAPIELPPVLAKLGPRRRPRTGRGPGSAARWACPR